MTKIVRSLVLAAGMAGLIVGGGFAVAPAQDKKDTKTTKAAKAGVIEINEGKDGKFRFVIRDGEGKLLAMSGPTGWEKREDAAKALDTLKEVLPTAKIAPATKKEEK